VANLENFTGLYEGWLPSSFVMFSIFYNSTRFLLTMRIDTLAADERSSGATPLHGGVGGYGWLGYVRRLLWVAKLIFLCLFLWNMYKLLTKSILLPNPVS
jgi:hypothetical protein